MIRKEMTTFRAAWNWAKQMLLIEPTFPDSPLKVPKMREKKRVRGTTTTRRVTLSRFLKDVLSEWLASHPAASISSRNRSPSAVVRGWDVFRYSFASNCAACGIDQRLIDEWQKCGADIGI